MIYLYLAICFVVGYFFGNVNFARILTWRTRKKDITQLGSKNPGAMNMLRTQGLGEALLTLACEAIKVGVPALCCYFIFETYFPGAGNFAYLVSAFGGILGHCFPVIYKFKGGKGVACTFGLFVFHPYFWWVSLLAFVFCFLLFFFVEYGFVVTLTFILIMTTYATVFFCLNGAEFFVWVLVILWVNFALILFLHRGNMKRLINGTESKVNFRKKVLQFFKGKKEDEESEDDTGAKEGSEKAEQKGEESADEERGEKE